MTPRRARPHPERGQASVELALLLPLILLLLLVILQVAVLGRDLVLVSHASREAARAAATDPSPGAALAAARAAGGLDPGRVQVEVLGGMAPGSRVRVTVTYRAPTDVPLVGALLGDRTLRSTTTMRVEWAARPVWLNPLTLRVEDKWDNPDNSGADSPFTHGTWEDLWSEWRNGSQGKEAPKVLDCPPSGAYRSSSHHAQPQIRSGGTLWRIHFRCSSARSPSQPVRRCWPC